VVLILFAVHRVVPLRSIKYILSPQLGEASFQVGGHFIKTGTLHHPLEIVADGHELVVYRTGLLGTALLEAQATTGKDFIPGHGQNDIGKLDPVHGRAIQFKSAPGPFYGSDDIVLGELLQDLGGKGHGGIDFFCDLLETDPSALHGLVGDIDSCTDSVLTGFREHGDIFYGSMQTSFNWDKDIRLSWGKQSPTQFCLHGLPAWDFGIPGQGPTQGHSCAGSGTLTRGDAKMANRAMGISRLPRARLSV